MHRINNFEILWNMSTKLCGFTYHIKLLGVALPLYISCHKWCQMVLITPCNVELKCVIMCFAFYKSYGDHQLGCQVFTAVVPLHNAETRKKGYQLRLMYVVVTLHACVQETSGYCLYCLRAHIVPHHSWCWGKSYSAILKRIQSKTITFIIKSVLFTQNIQKGRSSHTEGGLSYIPLSR